MLLSKKGNQTIEASEECGECLKQFAMKSKTLLRGFI